MLECFTGFMLAEHLHGQAFVPATGKFGHPTTITPHRRPYRTKDGFVVIMPASQEASDRFLAMGGFPDYQSHPKLKAATDGKSRVAAYYGLMEEAALTRTTAEWMAACAEAAIPAMRANRLGELFDDPHLKATGFFETRALPAGMGHYRAMKPPLKFSKTPMAIRRDPPTIGQHTDEVLAELEAGPGMAI